MYQLSETTRQKATNIYTGTSISISNALFLTKTKRHASSDFFDTDICRLFSIHEVTQAGDTVSYSDGQTSTVVCPDESYFKNGMFSMAREKMPELSLRENDDRLYIIFNVYTNKEEDVIVSFPGRGRHKIWLNELLICNDLYTSHQEDMAICHLCCGDNYFTVQSEPNQFYNDDTHFSMDVYPANQSLDFLHTQELSDSYSRDFYTYNVRRQYKLCYDRLNPFNTRYQFIPKDFTFFSDDTISVQLEDHENRIIYENTIKFYDVLDLGDLGLTAPVTLISRVRNIEQKQIILPAKLETSIERLRHEYTNNSKNVKYSSVLKNELEGILDFLQSEIWNGSQPYIYYRKKTPFLKINSDALLEASVMELFNGFKLLSHNYSDEDFNQFVCDVKIFTHTFETRYGDRQRIGLYFPEGYDPSRSYPLIVFNTTAPDLSILYERYKYLRNTLCHQHIIIMAITGRGVTSGNLINEFSFLDSFYEIKRLFAINENRIYLHGNCNGAYSAWALAEQYPHLFAAISVISGRPNTETVQNLTTVPILSVCETETAWLGSYYSYQFPREQLSPNNPQYIGFRLPEDHVDVSRFTLCGFVIRHLLQYVRDPYPRHFTFTTQKARHHKAFYIDILDFIPSNDTISVHVDVNESLDSINIQTQGIRVFSIDIPPYIANQYCMTVNGSAKILLTRQLCISLDSDTTFSVISSLQSKSSANSLWGEGLLSIFDRKVMAVYLQPQYREIANQLCCPGTNGYLPNIDITFPCIDGTYDTFWTCIDDNLILIGDDTFKQRAKSISVNKEGFTYLNEFIPMKCSLMWIEKVTDCKSILYVSGNDPTLMKNNMFLRKIIVPAYANGFHPYLNLALLVFDGKSYYGARNFGDPLTKIESGKKNGEINWDFADSDVLQSFTLSNGLRNASLTKDGLCMDIVDGDPFVINDHVQCDISGMNTVKLWFQNDTPGYTAQLFYLTSKCSDYEFLTFTTEKYDRGLREYILDLSEESKWDGILRIFRLDPSNYDVLQGKCVLKKMTITSAYPEYNYVKQYATTQGVNHWYYRHSNLASYTDLVYSVENVRWQSDEGSYIKGNRIGCVYPFSTAIQYICQRRGVIRISGDYQILTSSDNDFLRIRKNNKVLVDYRALTERSCPFDITTDVTPGDSILFETINNDGRNLPLEVELSPIISYL